MVIDMRTRLPRQHLLNRETQLRDFAKLLNSISDSLDRAVEEFERGEMRQILHKLQEKHQDRTHAAS